MPTPVYRAEVEKSDAEIEELEERSDELFCFYTALEVDIRTELQAAGFKDVETDYCDDTWCRWFSFNCDADLQRFYRMVAVVESKYEDEEWDRVGDSLYIQRTDLYAVYKQLVKCRMESR